MKAKRVYRNANIPFLAGMPTVVGVVIAILGVTNAKHGQAAVVVIGAVAVVAGLRMSMSGVWVGTDGVSVVDLFFGRHRVPWSELDHFTVKPFGRYPAVGYAVLRSGREYRTLAICSTTKLNPRHAKSSSKVQAMVDDLNEVLERHQHPAIGARGTIS